MLKWKPLLCVAPVDVSAICDMVEIISFSQGGEDNSRSSRLWVFPAMMKPDVTALWAAVLLENLHF